MDSRVHIHGSPLHGRPQNHHSHRHSADSSPSWLVEHLVPIFDHDPLPNAFLGITLITALTQILFGMTPHLGQSVLHFLVAFAGGSILGTVFLHLLPEIKPLTSNYLLILYGFLFFVIIDKSMRIIEGSQHTHSHSSVHIENKLTDKEDETTIHYQQAHSAHKDAKEPKPSPWLNVLADSMHNVTDGMALYFSFNAGSRTGATAILMMALHEIPHQIGDFALLVNSGLTSGAARKAQLVTILGTALGCTVAHNFGSLSVHFEELINPITAGIFLYVGTLSVLPELMEIDESAGKLSNTRTGLLQLAGVIAGITTVALLES